MSEMADIRRMEEDDTAWRKRLAAAIESSGKSMRAISKGAGKGPGYIHSILSEGKDPTLSNLLKVCDQLGVTLFEIVLGVDMTPEDEKILRLWRDASPADQEALLQLLKSHAARIPE